RRRGRPARPARRVRALHGPAVLRRARRALPRHRGAGRGRRRRRRAVSGTDERTARAPGPSGDPARDDAPGAAFQVDLRGVVDLLARHLYSSPRVYLRELLQNAVDAITARGALGDTDGPARIVLRPLAGGGLEVHDTGVGLTRDEAHELLATIGRSSKRDVELGTGREEFLGQFGIGLLSAFMVADEIELVSRSARPSVAGGPGAPGPPRRSAGAGARTGGTSSSSSPRTTPTRPRSPAAWCGCARAGTPSTGSRPRRSSRSRRTSARSCRSSCSSRRASTTRPRAVPTLP